jgi:hypothetical protein
MQFERLGKFLMSESFFSFLFYFVFASEEKFLIAADSQTIEECFQLEAEI